MNNYIIKKYESIFTKEMILNIFRYLSLIFYTIFSVEFIYGFISRQFILSLILLILYLFLGIYTYLSIKIANRIKKNCIKEINKLKEEKSYA